MASRSRFAKSLETAVHTFLETVLLYSPISVSCQLRYSENILGQTFFGERRWIQRISNSMACILC